MFSKLYFPFAQISYAFESSHATYPDISRKPSENVVHLKPLNFPTQPRTFEASEFSHTT